MALSATGSESTIRNDRARKSGMFDKFTRPVRALTTGLVLATGSPMVTDTILPANTHQLHAADKPAAAAALARVETKSESADAVVDTKKDLKPSDYDTLDDYFKAVIKRETAKGTLKKQNDFKIKDASGKEILDVQSYEAYKQGIIEKAKQFENPNDLEGLFNGIYVLQGNNSKKRVGLTADDAAYLISFGDYKQAYNLVARLFTEAKYRNDSVALKSLSERLIGDLKNGIPVDRIQ